MAQIFGNGLSSDEALKKLQTHGYNELPSAKPKTKWQIVINIIKEPIFLLLISCGILYGILGDFREGLILVSSIMVIIYITYYQYQKTEKALVALKTLSAPRVLVLRDGKEIRISGREVVPEDIIILNEGDRIAADAIVLEGINLTIDESILTGESIPVSKNANENKSTEGFIYSGTLVIKGKGAAKVVATGIETELGKIGTSIQNIEEETTRLQKEMKILIKTLFIIGFFISIIVVVAYYFTRGNFIKSLLNGLSAAMSILPEEFPVVMTIFMILGAWRLSKTNVLTRKPSVIETLGSATVLCSDKTGTITQNKMEVVALYNGEEIYFKNYFLERQDLFTNLLNTAQRASQNNSIDPMEKAINSTHKKMLLTTELDDKLIKEYPLSQDLLSMTRVTENTSGVTPEIGMSVSAKGAPEAIFELCKMSQVEKTMHFEAMHQMAEEGYRVIAVASGPIQNHPLPETQHEFDFKFLGLIGLEDPIRPEVPKAIEECRNAGIKVIMITGDYPITAKSIAKQIGLEPGDIITGDDLKQMSDNELGLRIKTISIFARVIPEQKLRIVTALKANNEIVAMTGDGVNDAPALKAANIGIAMGIKGTDVARESASLVLLDDNFASIVVAIRLGRRIFDNLQKAMSYILAIHIPIIGLSIIPAFFSNIPILLMPLHIVFLELIIDPVCSIAFETEQEEIGIMKRKPRDPNQLFFGRKKIGISFLKGLFLLAVVVSIYLFSIFENHTEGEIRAITFSSLVLGNIALISSNLSKTRSFLLVITEKNNAIILTLLVPIFLLSFALSIPSFQSIFSFEMLEYRHFLPAIIGAFFVLIVLESIKFYRNKYHIANNKILN